MNRNRRASIFGGIFLVLLGAFFLAREFYPDIFAFWDWPFIIIGLGALFLLWAVLGGIGGLAIPATILTGIGGILYYQNTTGNWESWSFIWALIPGFVGVGILLSGLIDRKFKASLDSGLTLIVISVILFLIFGTTFGMNYGLGQYWPVLLILLGLISLVRVIFRRKKKG
ncbi:MAG: hypothetical protein U9R53_06800 [Chloroflexota bacterium]|nr:hypothetical protein [Chloroflexota bacterium]